VHTRLPVEMGEGDDEVGPGSGGGEGKLHTALLARLAVPAEDRAALAGRADGPVHAHTARALLEAAATAEAENARLRRLLDSYTELAASSLLQQTGLGPTQCGNRQTRNPYTGKHCRWLTGCLWTCQGRRGRQPGQR
jgi:hypothetical protein